MFPSTSLLKARESLLGDAIRRDLVTARRAALLDLLWHERFLTREQLILRIEWKLGKACFGQSAWQDNFYRDMRVVKGALRAAGYTLRYSRGARREGYYLSDLRSLSAELSQIIRHSSTEVDPRQVEIFAHLSTAQKFRQGCSISDAARKVVAYRIQQEHPELSLKEANRLVLQRAYAP